MSHLSAPSADDPEVVEAMAFYDDVLTEDERREVYRSLFRCTLGWARTGNPEYLTGLGLSVRSMVILERNQPGVHEKLRNAPKTAAEAGGAMSIAEVREILRELSAPPGVASIHGARNAPPRAVRART